MTRTVSRRNATRRIRAGVLSGSAGKTYKYAGYQIIDADKLEAAEGGKVPKFEGNEYLFQGKNIKDIKKGDKEYREITGAEGKKYYIEKSEFEDREKVKEVNLLDFSDGFFFKKYEDRIDGIYCDSEEINRLGSAPEEEKKELEKYVCGFPMEWNKALYKMCKEGADCISCEKGPYSAGCKYLPHEMAGHGLNPFYGMCFEEVMRNGDVWNEIQGKLEPEPKDTRIWHFHPLRFMEHIKAMKLDGMIVPFEACYLMTDPKYRNTALGNYPVESAVADGETIEQQGCYVVSYANARREMLRLLGDSAKAEAMTPEKINNMKNIFGTGSGDMIQKKSMNDIFGAYENYWEHWTKEKQGMTWLLEELKRLDSGGKRVMILGIFDLSEVLSTLTNHMVGIKGLPDDNGFFSIKTIVPSSNNDNVRLEDKNKCKAYKMSNLKEIRIIFVDGNKE
jgi:hypothetical protein